MVNDLPGKFIGIILAFFLTVVMPFVNITVEDDLINRRLIVTDVCSFIDEVVDSRSVTSAMIKDLNVSLAQYGMSVDYDITRYVKSVNIDPKSTDDFYVSYIKNDDTSKFNKGDKISVHVYTHGYSAAGYLAHKLSGVFISELDTTITARIR